MPRADIERLSREYSAGEPREGRLARALQVDIPVWRELGDEIFRDLDHHVFGVGWWAPGPGTSRRVLISDHLYSCVRGVEPNLILVEREVSTSPVVVREVASQGAAQVPFAEDEDVIQTLAPDRADEPLREGVLPRAVGRRQDLIDSHAPHSLSERGP